jgi:hypothetical protein
MVRAVPVFFLVLVTSTYGENLADANAPVVFADANLRRLVSDTLDIQALTVADMQSLTCLENNDRYMMPWPVISDLAGLEHAVNLTRLSLVGDRHQDGIRDLTPLATLTRLEELELPFHEIANIQVLGSLSKLTRIDLRRNRLTDVSALQNLTTLTWLTLQDNPIENSVYDSQLLVIRNNNPHLDTLHDRFRLRQITVQLVLTGILITIGIGIIWRTFRATHLSAMIVMAILSGVTGGFLGIGAQLLYTFQYTIIMPRAPFPMNMIPSLIGADWGMAFGAIIGAGYITVVGYRREKKGPAKVSPARCGMTAGVICSTLVHTMLAMTYREGFAYIYIGAIFGAIAGAILGGITGVTYFKSQTPNTMKTKKTD